MADQPPPPPLTNIFYDPNPNRGPYFTLGPLPTRAEAATRRQDRERIRRRLVQSRLANSRYRARAAAAAAATAATAATAAATAISLTDIEHRFGIHITTIPPILRWLPSWFLQPGLETTVISLLQDSPKFFECMATFKDVQYSGEAIRYLSLAIMILRMRWAFKRLVNAAIIRSIDKRRPLPETDPISLEPMTNPIVIYSIPTRWRYAYDATTLIGYIRTQLSACAYGYPEPQIPRNPITNMEFTPAQLYSAYLQLAQRGKLCWQLGAYLAEGANLQRYERQFVVPIYRHDCAREVMDVENIEGAVSIVEFVYNTVSEMAGVNKGHIYVTLEQAFHSPRLRTHSYLSAWRKLYVRSIVECSSVSVDDIVLMHGNETAITELANTAAMLVQCFPAFFEDVRDVLQEEREARASQGRHTD